MAKERTPYSEEQRAVIKARRDERNAASRALTDALVAFNVAGKTKDELITLLDELKELAKVVQPKVATGSGSAGRTSVMSVVAGMFNDSDSIDEGTVFMEHKLGRAEMGTAIKNILKKFNPDERIWIAFDPESGVYSVAGRGANVPEGWTGFIPVDETIDEDESVESDEY